jgi:long-chain acyl-CoA synthetase
MLLHAHSLTDVLHELGRSRPNVDAMVCGGRRFTYSEFEARVDSLAAELSDQGFGAGDRLLWLGQNCHRLLESMLAAGRLGGVFCPANWRLSPAELAFVIKDCDPSAVIWQDSVIGPLAREALGLSGYDRVRIQHDEVGPGGYEAIAGRGGKPTEVAVDSRGAVLLIYTAAFDGQPNGALLSHEAAIAQSHVIAMAHSITPGYTYLNVGPIFHIATLMLTMATFVMGGVNVFTPRADPEEVLRLIDAERCQGAYIVEPTMSRMVELNRDRRYDLSCLVSPPASEGWNAMVDTKGSPWARNRGGYGQTEVFGMLTMRCLGGTGASGLPVPFAQVRIVSPDDEDLAPGEAGEIVARGPLVMIGYHNRSELNAQRQRGGWHHTNDLGRREPDGSITFVGPIGRMIKSGVENIYPAEVEACLNSHPAVLESVVIGVPDATWQQVVRAVVVLRPGAHAEEDELIEHCRSRIGSYKKPRSVVFVATLPRRDGRVDHDAVNREHHGGGYPGEAAAKPSGAPS